MSEMSCSMDRSMGEFPHYGKGNFPMAQTHALGQFPHMPKKNLDAFVRGLKLIADAEGVKMKPLSEAAGMSETGVKDLIRYGSSPKVSNAFALANELGRTVDEIIHIGMTGDLNVSQKPPTIAIAGQVGAGARVPVFDAYEKGDGPQVECPPGLSPHSIVAVEVVGDSMEPVYSAGDLLFYTRDTHDGVPDEAIGHRCVCEDEDGMGWVKQVKRGSEPGLFNLVSLNPGADNMHDVRLKWAARVRLHWPAELVRKVG